MVSTPTRLRAAFTEGVLAKCNYLQYNEREEKARDACVCDGG